MVAPKKVGFVKDVEKSPSPEPFKEPEGMVTIDLNAEQKNENDAKRSEKAGKKKASKICKTLIYLLLLVVVIFATFIFIDEHTHVLKRKLIPFRYTTRKVDTSKNQNLKLSEEKQRMLKCLAHQSLEDCCRIINVEDYPDFAQICRLNDMLDVVLVTFENRGVRKKRHLTPENAEAFKKDINVASQYINTISNALEQIPASLQNVPGEVNYEDNYYYDSSEAVDSPQIQYQYDEQLPIYEPDDPKLFPEEPPMYPPDMNAMYSNYPILREATENLDVPQNLFSQLTEDSPVNYLPNFNGPENENEPLNKISTYPPVPNLEQNQFVSQNDEVPQVEVRNEPIELPSRDIFQNYVPITEPFETHNIIFTSTQNPSADQHSLPPIQDLKTYYHESTTVQLNPMTSTISPIPIESTRTSTTVQSFQETTVLTSTTSPQDQFGSTLPSVTASSISTIGETESAFKTTTANQVTQTKTLQGNITFHHESTMNQADHMMSTIPTESEMTTSQKLFEDTSVPSITTSPKVQFGSTTPDNNIAISTTKIGGNDSDFQSTSVNQVIETTNSQRYTTTPTTIKENIREELKSEETSKEDKSDDTKNDSSSSASDESKQHSEEESNESSTAKLQLLSTPTLLTYESTTSQNERGVSIFDMEYPKGIVRKHEKANSEEVTNDPSTFKSELIFTPTPHKYESTTSQTPAKPSTFNQDSPEDILNQNPKTNSEAGLNDASTTKPESTSTPVLLIHESTMSQRESENSTFNPEHPIEIGKQNDVINSIEESRLASTFQLEPIVTPIVPQKEAEPSILNQEYGNQFETITEEIKSEHTAVPLHSRFNVREESNSKPKMDSSSQPEQAWMNPCFNPYFYQNTAPFRSNSPFDGTQVLKIVPMNTAKAINPPMYPYMPFMQVPPYMTNYMQPMAQQNNVGSSTIQASGPGGQYYLCNPITMPNNNVASIPGVEIRSAAGNLQDAIEGFNLDTNNTTRESSSLICPSGQFGCEDNSRCVPKYQVCDSDVHCDDGSDEWYCSCRDRVGALRICDGYLDCPNGEDELGCFGCLPNEFSCDDWSRSRKSTCIPSHQRCDNIKQCVITGKDEEDCSILTDRVGNQPQFKVSNAMGFLHRNYRGHWYPTCFGTELWATEICKVEGGPSINNPRSHMMLTLDNYDGEYINILPNNEVSLVKTCVKDRAAFVECPPLYCGLRMVIKNPYRPQEVDTYAEDLINQMERVGSSRNNFTDSDEDEEVLGTPRVVGGKPSQPAAWPWSVSIYKNGIFHCGGVIVNENWVVTAAHCLDKYWQYYYEIQAGILRRFSYAPMEQRRWAAMVIPHENYNRATLKNDIGLMKLSSPVRFNRYVRPICLPSETTAGRDFLTGPPAGTICTAVGWGATVEHGADPDHMREVEVPVLDHCIHTDDEDSEEICAGLSEGGKDACQGDSGGPFMCRNPNNPSQWYLAGIVSHGEGCARPNEPGVYTRVSKFSGWLAENMVDFRNSPKVPLQKCPGYICKGTGKCIPKKHHCDKLIDCLFGDDEMNCHYEFQDIFKNARPDVFLGKALGNVSAVVDVKLLNGTEDKLVKYNTKNVTVVDGNSTTKEYFECQRLSQLVQYRQKCDRRFDCEDGTDEANCTCVDYLKSFAPEAICDGITDCYDLLDEEHCGKCDPNSEYYCRQSKKCVDISKRCDHVADCSNGEDEWDCAALTDGETLTLDSDLRPVLAMSGIITINRFGVWRPFCANMSDDDAGDVAASVVAGVCSLLGLEEYAGYRKYTVEDKPLEVSVLHRRKKIYQPRSASGSNVTCSGLYIKCSNVTSDSHLHNVYQDNVTRDVELYTSPWNAVIYSEGIYRCMGTILNHDWVVSSVNCSKGITTAGSNYVTALLGKGKARLELKGPHEQIFRVIELIPVPGSDIMLMRLNKNISFNRYVKYLTISNRRDERRKERCYAVGLHKHNTKIVSMSPVDNCYVGYRCFESKIEEDCEEVQPWTGTIVCDSGRGWYPAAVYSVAEGQCGFSAVKNYTSVKHFRNQITRIMNKPPSVAATPKCDGFRCDLGGCVPKGKLCDGIPDCRGGEDEEPELCYQKEQECHLLDKCVCPPTHLKCNNNKCIPKEMFCDRKKDCEDGEDEPDVCSCRNFLKLTNSSQICDGVINCMDRTDEDPSICSCSPNSFVCGNSYKCISTDMVCDGIEDCPNGADETTCLALNGDPNKRLDAGEVFSRFAGIWHRGCFKANHTSDELREICKMLGLKSENGVQLKPENVGNMTVLRPEIHPFDSVWIRRTPGNKLTLGRRTGYEPYVNFVPDEGCFRLFLACI